MSNREEPRKTIKRLEPKHIIEGLEGYLEGSFDIEQNWLEKGEWKKVIIYTRQAVREAVTLIRTLQTENEELKTGLKQIRNSFKRIEAIDKKLKTLI